MVYKPKLRNVLYKVSSIFSHPYFTRDLNPAFTFLHFTTHINLSHKVPLFPPSIHCTSINFTSFLFITLLVVFHFTLLHFSTRLDDYTLSYVRIMYIVHVKRMLENKDSIRIFLSFTYDCAAFYTNL
jgi:hypothetical protein